MQTLAEDALPDSMSRHVVIVGRMRILPNMDSRPTCCPYVGAWRRVRRDGVMAGANHARWRRNTGEKPLAGLSLTFPMQRGQAWGRGSETWSLPTPCYYPASPWSKVQKKLAFSISMCPGPGLGRRGSTAGLGMCFWKLLRGVDEIRGGDDDITCFWAALFLVSGISRMVLP